MQIDNLGLYDIYDFYTIPFWKTGWFLSLVGLATCGIIGGISFVVWRFIQRPRTKSLLVTTQESIVSLQARIPVPEHDSAVWYEQLTGVIKDICMLYDTTYNKSMTDDELIQYLGTVYARKDVLVQLIPVVRIATQVKFNRGVVPPEQQLSDIVAVEAALAAYMQEIK